MRKTNSKETKRFFADYLSDILNDWFNGSILEMSRQFAESTCNGKRQFDGLKYGSYQEAFKEITWNYATPYFAEQKEMLMQALEQTEAEADKYTTEQTENLFNYLLYKSYCDRCKKENVNFYAL